jgi:Spy/CpxP family protein refolding chaperone
MLRARFLALCALLVVGVATVSEAQGTPTPRTYPESAPSAGDRPKMGQRGHARMDRRARGGFRLGRDLNLTESQRTQIAAIHQKYRPQHQALHDRARPFLDAARIARQNWDSAGYRINTERARQVLTGGEAIRNQEVAEIRNVLTVEQRTKFDARQKQMTERRSRMKAEGGWRGRANRSGQSGPGIKK